MNINGHITQKDASNFCGYAIGRLRALLSALYCLLLIETGLCAPIINQLDPYPVLGDRTIPDIRTGGNIGLPEDKIFDVLILGDGYLNQEDHWEYSDFFDDATSLYDSIFDPINGIRPFCLFPEAFRVHSLFEASDYRADGPDDEDRLSYYRVKINGDRIENTGYDGWWNYLTGADGDFRDRFLGSIDHLISRINTLINENGGMGAPVNLSCYPGDLDNIIDNDSVTEPMANRLSHLYVIMFVRIKDPDCTSSPDCQYSYELTGGAAPAILYSTGNQYVRTALGSVSHEFCHAFGYIRDEYISDPDDSATFHNPGPEEKSLFNLCNLSYSNERCDLLWPHLAPGGEYNPGPRSFVGNLFAGGYDMKGVWHSEFKCIMNGNGSVYACDLDAPESDRIDLRSDGQFCFWCEEIVATRILERCNQFYEEGDNEGINELGKIWYQRWVDRLRNKYYQRFDIPTLIAEKNTCWKSFTANNCNSDDCGQVCGANDYPYCLSDCEMRELGNAIYVNSTTGSGYNTGGKFDPILGLLNAIDRYQNYCDPSGTPLIVVQPSDYPGTYVFDEPAIFITESCGGVTIGE